MKLRNFFSSLLVIPFSLGCIPRNFGMKSIPPKKNKLIIGDIVTWKEWPDHRIRKNWVTISLVTQVWDDNMVMLNDRRGIHTRELTKVGHSDSITAAYGIVLSRS